MKKETLPWSQAKTLKETIGDLVEKKLTDSKEFKQLISFFGREKVKNLWLEFKREQEEKRNDRARTSFWRIN